MSDSPHTNGALILRIHGVSNTGVEFSAAAIVYISSDVAGFYMPEDVIIQLCIVPPGFPAIGGAPRYHNSHINEITENSANIECPCFPRKPPPGRPNKLPMDATEENGRGTELKRGTRTLYSTSVSISQPPK